MTQLSVGEQQPNRAGTDHRGDHCECPDVRPEAQRTPRSADRADREHRGGDHPIACAEGGLGAQRRGGADADEPVARQLSRQPSEPTVNSTAPAVSSTDPISVDAGTAAKFVVYLLMSGLLLRGGVSP